MSVILFSEEPVVQPSLSTSPPPPPSTTLPEIPEVPTAVEEPIVIPRKNKDKRRSTKTSENKNIPAKQTDQNEDRTLSISEATSTTISQEMINNESNVFKAPRATNDSSTENTSVISTTENEKDIAPTTDSQREIVQVNPTTNTSLEQSDSRSALMDQSNNEQPILTVDYRSGTDETIYNEISISANTQNTTQNDQTVVELPVEVTKSYIATDTTESTPAHYDAENTIEPTRDEIPVEQSSSEDTKSTATDYTDIQQSDPMKISDEKSTTDPYSESMLNDAPIDGFSAPAYSDDILLDKWDTENTKTEAVQSSDSLEASSLTNITADTETVSAASMYDDEIPVEQSTSENTMTEIQDYDKTSTLTNASELPPVDTEASFISTNKPTDAFSTSAYNDEIPEEQPTPQNITTDIEESPTDQSDLVETPNETLPIVDDTTKNTLTDTPADKSSAPMYDDEIADEQSTPQNTTTPSETLSASTNADDSSTTNATKTPTNEVTASIYDDEISEADSIAENTKTDIPDYEEPSIYQSDLVEIPHETSPILTDAADSSTTNATKTPIDEVTASIYDDEISEADSSAENTKTDIPDYEEPSIYQSDLLETPNETSSVSTTDAIKTPTDEVTTSIYDDELPEVDSSAENTKTDIPDYVLSTTADTEESPTKQSDIVETLNETLPIVDEKTENISTKEAAASMYDDEIPEESWSTANAKTVIHSEASVSDVVDIVANDPNQKDIAQDLEIEYTSLDAAKAYSQLESISLDISDDEALTTAVIVNSPSLHSVSENYSVSISDEDSSTSKPDQEKPVLPLLDDQVPTTDTTIDLANTNSNFENISIDIPDDDSPTIHSTEENFQMILTDAKLPTSETVDDVPIVQSLPEDTAHDTRDYDDDYNDELPKPIPTATKSAFIEQSVLRDKLSTLINDLEDSYEEVKAVDIPEQRAPTPPPPETPQLASLRQLISQIEIDEDDDDDNEFLLAKQKSTVIPEKKITTDIKPSNSPEQTPPLTSLHEMKSKIEDDDDDNVFLSPKQKGAVVPEKKATTDFKSSNLAKMRKTRLSSSSISDSDDIFGTSSALSHATSDVPSTNNITETLSTASIESKSLEKKRSSTVNSHPIPAGTKLLQVTCSSTYIYLCTTERKIFYAKFNPEKLSQSYYWQQHIDLAEQLLVSNSNQTVWRFHNKILYAADDPIKSPPLGAHWSRIKLDGDQSYLSMSINDQCGW